MQHDDLIAANLARLGTIFPEVARAAALDLHAMGVAGANNITTLHAAMTSGPFKAGHVHALIDLKEAFERRQDAYKVICYQKMIGYALEAARMDKIMIQNDRPSAEELYKIAERLPADPIFDDIYARMYGYAERVSCAAPAPVAYA